jgi:hypothetical protein
MDRGHARAGAGEEDRGAGHARDAARREIGEQSATAIGAWFRICATATLSKTQVNLKLVPGVDGRLESPTTSPISS